MLLKSTEHSKKIWIILQKKGNDVPKNKEKQKETWKEREANLPKQLKIFHQQLKGVLLKRTQRKEKETAGIKIKTASSEKREDLPSFTLFSNHVLLGQKEWKKSASFLKTDLQD